ncbi:leucyl aminopeptidase [Rhodoferax sp. GW822-FHT02A01]|uniref:leucyl aminopeptidase n=1 Tax=Rhodoferax sp. GW822-FHT02A01 TaxID=3141537 RepID=UPI00315CE766
MNFELKSLSLAQAATEKCDALLVLLGDDYKPAKDGFSALIGRALKDGDAQTKAGKVLALYKPPVVQAARVVLAGIGDGSAKQVRSAVSAAYAAAKSDKLKKLVVVFASNPSAAALRAAVAATADASYSYTTTKSKGEARVLQSVLVGAGNADELAGGFERATAVVAGVEFAKEWANRPANHATPTVLAKAAQSLAKHARITCDVLDAKAVTKLGMGAFLAVAQGSEEPLRFIVLKYSGAAKSAAPTVLVGKGITFDSGGISIKPAAEMDEMKFDMSGAASVLGVFRTLSELKPAINVVGLIPACENLLNGRAVKPGDVVTSMSGQTIEILNTDAEGRLVLCDALTYAERFKPKAVIDIATLTGACVVALGAVRSGLFSSDEALAQALGAAGDAAQDLCWRMPLDEEYAEGLKTQFADVTNVAGRAAGAVTAAKYLQRFTEKYPWAHLDIAGTAWKSGAAKGATGRPVGLLVEYLLTPAQAAAK